MGFQCGLVAAFGSRISALDLCRADRREGAGHRRPPGGGLQGGQERRECGRRHPRPPTPAALVPRKAGGMSGGATAGAALLALALAAAGEAATVLRDGGYEGLLAAVHPRVPEDGRLVARLQVRRKAAGPGRGSPGWGTGPDASFKPPLSCATNAVVEIDSGMNTNPVFSLHVCQEMITEASSYLFKATKGRVYFRSVKILIPPTWKEKSYEKPKHETYEKVRLNTSCRKWGATKSYLNIYLYVQMYKNF